MPQFRITEHSIPLVYVQFQFREYKENMKYVDDRIEKVVKITEEYFNDNGTAYVFTADHGMTDWGSHGSGSADETETPLVAWGAGINKEAKRQDIEQADIAPFVSSLLGLSIPVNSEGILPLNYLASEYKRYGAHALRSNVAQLRTQVRANRMVCSGADSSDTHRRERELDEKVQKMNRYLSNGKIMEAIEEGQSAILLCKELLAYYRGYQRNRFIIYLTLAWLGWLILLFAKLVVAEHDRFSFQKDRTYGLCSVNIIFFIAAVIILTENQLSGRPGWRVPGYGIVSLVSLWLATRSAIFLITPCPMKNNGWSIAPTAATILLIVCMYTALIVRWSLAIGMIIIAVTQKNFMRETTPRLWRSAGILAIFPILPAVGHEPQTFLVIAGLCLAGIYLMKLRTVSVRLKRMEIARLAATATVVAGIVDGRSCISWIILISAPIFIFLHPTNAAERIVGVLYGLLCPYSLLSASYEPIFYLVFATHLLAWPTASISIRKRYEDGAMASENVLKASFFMLYALLCFFGTGNMASISSFDPTWTRHFITVFSPFAMSALILLKLSIPLILVGCTSRVFSLAQVFPAVLFLGDCLALPLMYGITAQGSWLDIGTAISRYTIAIALPCLLFILNHVSQPLMSLCITSSLSDAPKTKHSV